jgi:hypothetical protein
MAQPDDVKTAAVARVVLLGTILVMAIILLLDVVTAVVVRQQLRQDEAEPAVTRLDKARTRQQARLAEYRWVDEKAGRVAVPVDRAMELVIDDLAAGKEQDRAKTK